jgi:hypothetical protein
MEQVLRVLGFPCHTQTGIVTLCVSPEVRSAAPLFLPSTSLLPQIDEPPKLFNANKQLELTPGCFFPQT